jgi:hypothetical protein
MTDGLSRHTLPHSKQGRIVLVGNCDPALSQQVFNLPKTQAETVVKTNGMADDIRRKSVSVIVGRIGGH